METASLCERRPDYQVKPIEWTVPSFILNDKSLSCLFKKYPLTVLTESSLSSACISVARRGRCFPEPSAQTTSSNLSPGLVAPLVVEVSQCLNLNREVCFKSTEFFCCRLTAPHLAGLQYVDLLLIHSVLVLFQETFTLVFHLSGETENIPCYKQSRCLYFNHACAGYRTDDNLCSQWPTGRLQGLEVQTFQSFKSYWISICKAC